jgi:hypothetical protein
MASRRTPRYLDLLCKSDLHIYEKICEALAAPTNRDRRFKRLEDFQEILEAIELFENIDDGDRWKRCLVCGIFRFNGGIAVNISQLKAMILKCKSSINGSLKRLGYTDVVKKADATEHILQAIPYLAGRTSDLRKWTVRYLAEAQVTPPPSDVEPEVALSVEPEIAPDYPELTSWFEMEPLEIRFEEALFFE